MRNVSTELPLDNTTDVDHPSLPKAAWNIARRVHDAPTLPISVCKNFISPSRRLLRHHCGSQGSVVLAGILSSANDRNRWDWKGALLRRIWLPNWQSMHIWNLFWTFVIRKRNLTSISESISRFQVFSTSHIVPTRERRSHFGTYGTSGKFGSITIRYCKRSLLRAEGRCGCWFRMLLVMKASNVVQNQVCLGWSVKSVPSPRAWCFRISKFIMSTRNAFWRWVFYKYLSFRLQKLMFRHLSAKWEHVSQRPKGYGFDIEECGFLAQSSK